MFPDVTSSSYQLIFSNLENPWEWYCKKFTGLQVRKFHLSAHLFMLSFFGAHFPKILVKPFMFKVSIHGNGCFLFSVDIGWLTKMLRCPYFTDRGQQQETSPKSNTGLSGMQHKQPGKDGMWGRGFNPGEIRCVRLDWWLGNVSHLCWFELIVVEQTVTIAGVGMCSLHDKLR